MQRLRDAVDGLRRRRDAVDGLRRPRDAVDHSTVAEDFDGIRGVCEATNTGREGCAQATSSISTRHGVTEVVAAALALVVLANKYVLRGLAHRHLAVVMVKMLAVCAGCKQRPPVCSVAFEESVGHLYKGSPRFDCALNLCFDCFRARVTRRRRQQQQYSRRVPTAQERVANTCKATLIVAMFSALVAAMTEEAGCDLWLQTDFHLDNFFRTVVSGILARIICECITYVRSNSLVKKHAHARRAIGRLAPNSDVCVALFLRTGQLRSSVADYCRALAYSPDGATIVTGSSRKAQRLWNATSGKCRFVLEHMVSLVLKRHREEPTDDDAAQEEHPLQSSLDITLCTHVPASTPYDPATHVALQKGGKRWLVDRLSLMAFSEFARAQLEVGGNEEAVIILDDSPHCTDNAITLFATWINHYASSATPTSYRYPLKQGHDRTVSLDWETRFMRSCVVPSGNMKNSQMLWLLAGVALYFGSMILVEKCCVFAATQVRNVVERREESYGSPTAVIRSWFGLDGEFSDDELEAIVNSYLSDIIIDVEKVEKKAEEAHAVAMSYRQAAASPE